MLCALLQTPRHNSSILNWAKHKKNVYYLYVSYVQSILYGLPVSDTKNIISMIKYDLLIYLKTNQIAEKSSYEI